MRRLLLIGAVCAPLALVASTGSGAVGSGTVVSITSSAIGNTRAYTAHGTLARAGRIPGPIHRATLTIRKDGIALASTTIVLRRRDLQVSGSASAGCTPLRRGPLHTWQAVMAIQGGPTLRSVAVRSRCR